MTGARGAGAVRAAAAVLLAVALVTVAVRGIEEPGVALAFTALIALGECVRITLPGDREQAPIGAAGALAYALLGPLRGLPTAHGTLQVVAITGIGLLLAWLPGLALPRPSRPHRRPPWADPARRDSAARRLLGVGFAAAVFQPLYNGGLVDRFSPEGPAYGVFLTAVAALAALCDATLAAVLRCDWAWRPGFVVGPEGGPGGGGVRASQGGGRGHRPAAGKARGTSAARPRTGLRFPAALEDELRSLFGIGSAIVATGMLVSLAAGEVGLWALPLFCTPLLLAQVSFRRAAAVRATTGQTIASLARATEVAGYTPHGHARRVADTACALGRELGLGTRELALLEYAALMHDIGQLSLVEPVPDGATALLPCAEQQRIARLGSEVISRTGVPRQVAEQVARLADPCAGPAGGDGSVPLAARIIRVANAHDDLLTAARGRGVGEAVGRLEAMEVLRLGRGRVYDARVVDALARVGGQSRG
ncbi:HD domain-containing protein [Kitasatospora aureofaciens]|uniref:HD domain-containing protein n=1 Tax=Kitasatospora aureofaciens TaxID=1894 RepID=UPI001C44A4C1|nr:HD domain-containing phosphohydrolase [Kitasatospora aureofaciens]MBV6700035.1 metal-dependent phosphohydrolase [Kitasatospora aureofaciens]